MEICDRDEGDNSASAIAVAHAIRCALEGVPQKFALDYLLHSLNEPRWFRTIASLIDTSRVLLIHMDITLQKNLEFDLLAREDNHLLPLNRAVESIFALERDGLCTFCNQAAAKLLGFRKPLSSPIILNLNSIVTRMEETLRHMIGGGVNLTVVLDEELPLIEADPERIEQVLMNLAFNAADAMPNGGNLVIQTAHRSAEYVTLNVSDNGCGMDPSTRARIFEPFFSAKGWREGTGLGLFPVKQIVEQSGGRIFVQSEPGNGTSFTIDLPVVKPSGSPPQSRRRFTPPSGDGEHPRYRRRGIPANAHWRHATVERLHGAPCPMIWPTDEVGETLPEADCTDAE